MSDRRREGEVDPVELAALADGSLAPERRDALEAEVAASPELAARLAEQERAVALARGAAAEIEAPAGLRARVETQRRPRRSRRLVVAVAAVAVGVAVTVAVIRPGGGSPQRFHAALAGTGGASGRATLTKTASGWRIELDATGLPRLDGGRFYEAWLKDAGGVLVPIGTFNEGRGVTLWAGVSPKEYTALSVTRERADGDQGSSGEKVLAGTVER